MASASRCYVGNLALDTTESSLSMDFDPYGVILDLQVMRDRDTGNSRGFGFVTFADSKSVNDAIEALNRSDLDGNIIIVNQATS